MQPGSSTVVDITTYVIQLEKRLHEQEQLIALLNEKLAAVTASSDGSGAGSGPGISASAWSSGSGARHRSQRNSTDRGVSFVGSRKTDNVQAVAPSKYTQYFVSRVSPDVSAEVLAKDLLSSVGDVTSVRCSKMKTRHTSYASFHVVIPADQCHLVDSGGAWPEGSFVKIFSGRLLPNFVLESFDSDAPLTAPPGKGKGKPKEPKKTTQTSNKTSNVQSKPKPSVVNSPSNVGGGERLSTGSTFSPLTSGVRGGVAGSSKSSTGGTNAKSDKASSGAKDKTDRVSTSPKNLRPVRSGIKKV